MSENDVQFTEIQRCRHCDMDVPLQIVATHRVAVAIGQTDHVPKNERHLDYELLSCPVCQGVTLECFDRPDSSRYQTAPRFETLYPAKNDIPAIFSTTHAAYHRFPRIDPVAYAAILRHLAIIHECNRRKRA